MIWYDSAQNYKIIPWKTKSRSLLVITANLVLILLTLDVLLLALLPQYSTFSSQHYVSCADNSSTPYPPLPTPLTDSDAVDKSTPLIASALGSGCEDVVPCDWFAPEGQCVMTRISVLWTRVCYKTWYFGTIFYCITWILLAVLVLEGCIATFRPSHTSSGASRIPPSPASSA